MREKRRGFTSSQCTGFSLLGGMGESPQLCKSLRIPPPRKIPHPPTYHIFIPPPTKQQFSSYNPIKTAFLAVAIAPAPSLF